MLARPRSSGDGDPQIKECLEACKKCEALCREMAKVMVDPESDAAKAK